MKILYDERFVPAHGRNLEASVLLINEAPGPNEALSGIPLFGRQGANLFHALRDAGIIWAGSFPNFAWPENVSEHEDLRHAKKREFLVTRAQYITCTNSYPYWPKPVDHPANFCPPLEKHVLSRQNLERLRLEILPTHAVILICGRVAYIACMGAALKNPSQRELSELSDTEIKNINARLNSKFKKGWYMGHTRRWLIRKQNTASTLRALAQYVNWPCDDSPH